MSEKHNRIPPIMGVGALDLGEIRRQIQSGPPFVKMTVFPNYRMNCYSSCAEAFGAVGIEDKAAANNDPPALAFITPDGEWHVFVLGRDTLELLAQFTALLNEGEPVAEEFIHPDSDDVDDPEAAGIEAAAKRSTEAL